MLQQTEKTLPKIVTLFPGLTERVYFQHPQTKEYWFHAMGVCTVLGFKNLTSALALYCDDDEKLMEVVAGRDTWFVSEAGCYGLAMGAKNDVAMNFKRWLKHDVLPKLRADGGIILPSASASQLQKLKRDIERLEAEKLSVERSNRRLVTANKKLKDDHRTLVRAKLKEVYQDSVTINPDGTEVRHKRVYGKVPACLIKA